MVYCGEVGNSDLLDLLKIQSESNLELKFSTSAQVKFENLYFKNLRQNLLCFRRLLGRPSL